MAQRFTFGLQPLGACARPGSPPIQQICRDGSPGIGVRQPDPISLNVSPQALRPSGPQHPCHLRHPQVSAPPAQARSPRASEITPVTLKYHLGVPVLTARTPAPITRSRYLYEGPQSTPAPSNPGKPPNLIPKTPIPPVGIGLQPAIPRRPRPEAPRPILGARGLGSVLHSRDPHHLSSWDRELAPPPS